MSTSSRSAALPGSRLPTSSRPRQRAPPRVAIQSTSSAVSQRDGSRPWRWASSAWRASASMFELSLLAEPSTPRPTGTPASSISRTGAMPEPRRKLELGQWATPVPVSPKRRDLVRRRGARSGRARRRGRASRAASGTRPAGSRRPPGSSAPRRASRPGGCAGARRARAPARRCAASGPSVTEKGEQGASAIRSIARGRGSWYSRIRRGESARIVSSSWHDVVRGQAALALAPAHRAARGVEADAQLARGRDLDVDEPLLPAREEVEVVGGGRAAGEQQLAQAHAGRARRPRPRRGGARPRRAR